MDRRRIVLPGMVDFVLTCVLVGAVAVSASGQNPSPQTPIGWNAAVWSTSGNITPVSAYALVDATQAPGSDICTMINNIFSVYQSSSVNGIVIDARGVPTSALTCSSATSPWDNLLAGGSSGFSNIVLLPAGTITIQKTWTLPNWTRLIGQGPKNSLIKAGTGFSSDMIDMGSESLNLCPIASQVWDCPGVVIEHLGIQGSGSNKGIVNCCAQELSRVNDVSISNVATGLSLNDQFAENSGPYTNLTIAASSTCLSIGPAKAGNIMFDTRGVHGLSCTVTSTSSVAAITVDGPNNTLEDISILGASATNTDGILIGSQASAQGNTLINVQASTVKNVIHISKKATTQTSGTGNCPYLPPTVYSVCDVTILGVEAGTGTNTVQDDLTGSTIKDATLAMYTIGELVGTNSTNIGYSRYTTATGAGSTSATPWLVGVTGPIGSCSAGTLYSCTGSSCTAAVWQCVGSAWKSIQ